MRWRIPLSMLWRILRWRIRSARLGAMSIGTKIRERRQGLGLSQKELAQRAGMAQSNLSRLETALYLTPTLEHATALARELGIPLSALLADEHAAAVEARDDNVPF